MTFDRTRWTVPFTKDRVPSWPCPRCEEGTLVPVKESFTEKLTAESRQAYAHQAWEPEWDRGRFAGRLVCTRTECTEPVVVCGDTRGVVDDVDPETGGPTYTTAFHPVFFHPALPLFRVPPKCTEEIRAELKRAWALYWSDSASCANRVRTCVELVLTHLRIPRSTRSQKNRKIRLKLHDRIELFKQRNAELAQALMAVKWIGNIGSHEGGAGGVGREDILNGLELLEHVLVEVFEQRSKRLARMGKQIVKRKGRPKRS
ncbi:DUF4145 domain-containing protein [Hyalangium gracile]|uniref:DUF4145 domain-containing protein n=1 Tax=Hyalangium gracile TaxID=394092 RepID=UPI001CCA9B48|nr:DUF4145 domain-containing protein [Hyalangium gracile]